MNLPTLYFLTVQKCPNDWALYEQHQCQEKGCFKTDKQLVGWFETKIAALYAAENYHERLIEGVVESIEVIE